MRSSRATCTIGDWAMLGAYAGVHQFCRVGAHAMIAAGAIVLQDVPPYVTVAGYPAKPAGTNNEGLRRRGFAAGRHRRGAPRVQDALPRRAWRSTSARRRARARRARTAPAARAARRRSCRRAGRGIVARDGGRSPIGIVAGEASGDALGATLIEAVRRRRPARRVRRHRGAAGWKRPAARSWVPIEKLAVRGFAEVVAHLPRARRAAPATRAPLPRGARAALHRRRRARLQPRPRAQG